LYYGMGYAGTAGSSPSLLRDIFTMRKIDH
jgi:hypothetical protein